MADPGSASRFVGSLLGLAVGDALGSQFEGQSEEYLRSRVRTLDRLLEHIPPNGLYYTDDTQMAIGVAETLVGCQRIDSAVLVERFAKNYAPHRGYGRGTRTLLHAMLTGQDHESLAASQFPGGSFGNGAAMRVAPVGLMFCRDHARIWEEAKLSALPTHTHPLGIEGAQLLACAVGMAALADHFDRANFLDSLIARCESAEYSAPLKRLARIRDPKDLVLFGNGIEATASVVTAIACFTLSPDSYTQTIGNAIFLGGDTDTIAAMSGAISGAYLGEQALPDRLVASLENGHQGKDHLEYLARRLFLAHQTARGGQPN